MTATVVPLHLHSASSLREAVVRINQKFEQALDSDRKTERCRLAAGQMLVELRKRIESGEAGPGVEWWRWYEDSGFVRSRKDAEKVMKLASANDPEAAHEEEKAKAREGMRRTRAAAAANVSGRQAADPEWLAMGLGRPPQGGPAEVSEVPLHSRHRDPGRKRRTKSEIELDRLEEVVGFLGGLCALEELAIPPLSGEFVAELCEEIRTARKQLAHFEQRIKARSQWPVRAPEPLGGQHG